MVETDLNVRSDFRQQLIWELTELRQRKMSQTIVKEDCINGFDANFTNQLLMWMSFGFTMALISLIYELFSKIYECCSN